MAIETDTSSPNFGLETDPTSPNFGLPEQTQQSQQQGGTSLGQKIAIGAATGVRIAGGLATIPAEALEIVPGAGTAVKAGIGAALGGVSDAIAQGIESAAGVRQQFSPAELGVAAGLQAIPLGEFAQVGRAARTGIRALQGAGLGAAGTQATSLLEGRGPASLEDTLFGAGIGGGFAAGGEVVAPRVRSLTESLFGRENPTAIAPEALVPETPVTDAVTGVQDRQLMVQPERRFTIVPEPRPEVAAVQPIEQQVAQLPGQRVIQTPEGDVPVFETGAGRTGIQAETARVGGEQPNAVQEPSTGAILQRQPQETGATGGERVGVEQGVQGQETAKTRPETSQVAGTTASIPTMITKRMEADLRNQGFSQEEINKMTPQEAHQKLNSKPTVPQPEQPPIQTSDQPVVSRIANRFVDERVASGELGEIAPGQGYSARELAARGLQMSPEEVTQHMSDLVNKTGDPIKQAAAVRAEEARLSQRSAEASRIAQANPSDVQAKINADNAFKDLTDFHKGPLARLKTVFHGTGEGLQGELPVDLSTYNGLREKWLKETGEAPPKHMEPQMRKTADQVKGALDEENGAMKKLGDEIDKSVGRRKLPSPEEVADNIQGRMKVEPCIV